LSGLLASILLGLPADTLSGLLHSILLRLLDDTLSGRLHRILLGLLNATLSGRLHRILLGLRVRTLCRLRLLVGRSRRPRWMGWRSGLVIGVTLGTLRSFLVILVIVIGLGPDKHGKRE
jgi:hypothetical protein